MVVMLPSESALVSCIENSLSLMECASNEAAAIVLTEALPIWVPSWDILLCYKGLLSWFTAAIPWAQHVLSIPPGVWSTSKQKSLLDSPGEPALISIAHGALIACFHPRRTAHAPPLASFIKMKFGISFFSEGYSLLGKAFEPFNACPYRLQMTQPCPINKLCCKLSITLISLLQMGIWLHKLSLSIHLPLLW